MKCANARIENGFIQFQCPHCSEGLHADESQVQQIWATMKGQIACPVDTCQQAIILPTVDDVAMLKATAALETPPAKAQPEKPAVAQEPEDDKTPTEVAGAAPVHEAAPTPTPAPVPRPAPTPTPAPVPMAEAAAPIATPETAPAQEAATLATEQETAVAEPAPTGTPGNIVHGFGSTSDAPMTLEEEARSGSTMTIKTIRHSDCMDGDKDIFDETVTNFLRKQGDDNIISVNPIQFSDDAKKPIDYGVLIFFKVVTPE